MMVCPKCGYIRRPEDQAPDYECPKCGVVYAKVDPAEEDLPPAWRVRQKPERHSRIEIGQANFSDFSRRQLFGLVGAAVMAFGVFMPLMTGPFGMNVNYFSNGQGDGAFVLGLAVCSAVLVLFKRFALLWATGGLSFGVIAYAFFEIRSRIAEVKSSMDADLQGNPFRGLADAAMSSVQMQWGWMVLVAGAVLILLCAWMKDPVR